MQVDHQGRDGLEHKVERLLVHGTTAPSPLYNSPWPPGTTTNATFPFGSSSSDGTTSKINLQTNSSSIVESPRNSRSNSKVLGLDFNRGYRSVGRVSQNFGIFFSNMEERGEHVSIILNQSGPQFIDLGSCQGQQPSNSIISSKTGSRASSLVPSDEIDLEGERVSAALRDPSQDQI